ncbi:hypothetical protein [Streptomyces agglomeratus]|uniref:hypothetical protein n=1 Tax=Streptomyces agglomeratus TaxID=285458 RepID=UPI00210DAA7F|nr:hypothetical protein [Streptomyces agglomeratus]
MAPRLLAVGLVLTGAVSACGPLSALVSTAEAAPAQGAVELSRASCPGARSGLAEADQR